MKNQTHGFTLIELLIVVAIIGILAAIAVPNFLNAQMRAKIAHVQSDFKALSTSMEMYQMDNNMYPPPFKLSALTSPISYMSNVPQDVFPPSYDLARGGGQTEAGAAVTWYRYVYGTDKSDIGGSAGLKTAHCADFWAYFPPFLLRGAAESRANSEGCNTIWLIKSFGPNVNTNSLCGTNGDDCTFRYDATNGLISIGDIAVFGPGGRIQ